MNNYLQTQTKQMGTDPTTDYGIWLAVREAGLRIAHAVRIAAHARRSSNLALLSKGLYAFTGAIAEQYNLRRNDAEGI